MNTHTIRHDTKAWKAQVWISFFAAASLCATGLAFLPGRDLDRASMVMGYMFCLLAAFALAKFIRDNEGRAVDTPLWRLVVWGAFALAMGLTGWGLVQMEINPAYKAFLGVSWLFLIATAFTLAKTLRDAHDGAIAEARGASIGVRRARVRLTRLSTRHQGVDMNHPVFHRSSCSVALRGLFLAAALTLALAPTARAQSAISDASALSALPIAISVVAPVAVLSAGAALTIVTVEATSTGAVWVLERASDGTRASIRLVGRGIAGASIAAGTVIACTALSTGYVLSAAGEAIAFVPNEIGRALLYNERITR